jgi:hypothetical protein
MTIPNRGRHPPGGEIGRPMLVTTMSQTWNHISMTRANTQEKGAFKCWE